MKLAMLISLFIIPATSACAQIALNFDSLITTNQVNVTYSLNNFSGKGWDQLVERAHKSNYVLIGEDHFISEVPIFTEALAERVRFDNYICEIDQWMLSIFRSKIITLNAAQLTTWISVNAKGFSFFQKKNEFELMEHLLDQKVNLIGIEQVGLMSTTILFQYLVETGSNKNKNLYAVLRDSSEAVNNRFFNDYNKPFFLLTEFFTQTIQQADNSVMSSEEVELVHALIQSAEIYRTGSHRNRVKLMQANLMNLYPQTLKGKRNLFKFGANHSMKGESYIPVYDWYNRARGGAE
jgi:hypothetical protein